MVKKISLVVLGLIDFFIVAPIRTTFLFMTFALVSSYIFFNISLSRMTTNKFYDSSKHSYSAQNSSITYNEYYFKNDQNIFFENHGSYKVVYNEEIDSLKSNIETHKKNISLFDHDISWYTFDTNTQVKENDLINMDYEDYNNFELFYFDKDRSILYYFSVHLN